jgi:sugar lactone lactonase YvrE
MERNLFQPGPVIFLNYLSLLVVLFARPVQGQILVGYNPSDSLGSGLVAEYSASGQSLNPSFLSTPWLTYPAEMALDGNDIFVLDHVNGRISEFNTSGTDLNPVFLETTSGYGMCGDGHGSLYVSYPGSGTVASYSTSGALLNGSLVSGLNEPVAVATQGSLLYAANIANGTVGQYTTSGATLNTSFASGLEGTQCIAVDSQGNVYVERVVGEWGLNCIDKYSSSGTLLQQNLVVLSGLDLVGMTVSGNDLYVLQSNGTTGTVAEYSTDGTLLNGDLIDGIPDPWSIYIIPEPSCGVLAMLGLVLVVGGTRVKDPSFSL